MATFADLNKYYLAYFGRPVDYMGAKEWASKSNAEVEAAFAASGESKTLYASSDLPGFINNVYTNVIGRVAEKAGLDYWVNQILTGKITQAGAAMAILGDALLTGDKAAVQNKLAAAESFYNAIDTAAEAVAYSGTTAAASARAFIAGITSTPATADQVTTALANVAAAGTSGSGSTLTLTTGVDTVTGTSGNNTIDGSRVVLAGQVLNSLGNADQIDGGVGSDTLFVQMSEALDIAPAVLKNVETVSIENMNAGARVLNLVNADASVTTIKSANNVSGLTVNNIQSAVTDYDLATTAQAFTAAVTTAKLAGATDAANLKLTNVTGAAAVTIGNIAATGGNGYETINISSNGTVANSITLDDTAGAAAAGSLAKITVAGDQALTLASVANMTTVTTVDASTMVGALTYTAAAANGQNMTVTGGKGNDIIDVQGFATTDTINGGDGTDRLVLTNAEAIAATTARTNVTNVEWLRLSNTTDGTAITVGNVAVGATGLQLGAAVNHTGNVVANFAAGTANFDRQASTDNGNETTTLTVAGVATTDVVNVTLGTAAAASVWDGTGAFTITGAETVNITTLGGAATIGGALTLTNTASTEAIVVTGSQNLTITGVVTADSLNASGMTGAATLTMTGGSAAQSISITGSANADTLVGGTAADIINGGAGADTIRNAASGANSAANDVLSGGAGNDSYQLVGSSASAANYNGSAYIADFTVGTTATNGDLLVLDITAATYGAGTGLVQGGGALAATAAGAATTLIQTVAQNAAATAVVAGTDLIKLTTAVAAGANLQTSFNSAIGTATVTGVTADSEMFAMFYDTTNSRAVVVMVDADAGGGGNTVIGTGDTVTLVGTINMSAADYAAFNSNNLAFVDF